MKRNPVDRLTGATLELQRLDSLVGRWRTSGHVVAAGGEDVVQITGTDVYEWLPGGHFLIHWVDVSIGGQDTHNLEVIGYDPATNRYPTRFFDHEGNSGTYTAMVLDEVLHLSTDGARATLVLDPAGARMQANWEKMDKHGAWRPWMELEFTRLQ